MDDAADKYIVISYTNATLVLAIGETVEEVTDSGLLGRAPTLAVQLMQDNSMVQVRASGRIGGQRRERPQGHTHAPAFTGAALCEVPKKNEGGGHV